MRKWQYFGHVARVTRLQKQLMERKVEGKRRRGRNPAELQKTDFYGEEFYAHPLAARVALPQEGESSVGKGDQLGAVLYL